MIWVSAFLLGFLGSLHCVSMCGPIAMAMPRNANLVAGRLIYNLGRTTTYMLMGLVVGLLGLGMSLAGSQQLLSIAAGVILLIGAVSTSTLQIRGVSPLLNRLKSSMRNYLKKTSLSGHYVLGLLNGFLPCGLVYIGLAASAATGTPVKGAMFMGLFGLGTIPSLLALSLGVSLFKFNARMKRLIPVFVAMIGILFILRGLGLGIPYISPDLSGPMMQHHHH